MKKEWETISEANETPEEVMQEDVTVEPTV